MKVAEKGTKKMVRKGDPPDNERAIFALTLLLCTPSTLNALFVGTIDQNTGKPSAPARDAMEKHLTNDLNFDKAVVPVCMQVIDALRDHRFVFQEVAVTKQQFSNFYSGPTPHPSNADAAFIVQKLTKCVA